jgi:hypothetical protein
MYELDHAKDQLMTLLKVGLANLGIWVRDQYFSQIYQNCGWQRLWSFFKLGGWITTTASEVQMELLLIDTLTQQREITVVLSVVKRALLHRYHLPMYFLHKTCLPVLS